MATFLGEEGELGWFCLQGTAKDLENTALDHWSPKRCRDIEQVKSGVMLPKEKSVIQDV